VTKSGFIVACGFFVGAVLAGAQTQRTIWDGVYSEEQAKRGEQLYGEHCARCHGEGLGGVE
jgi:mono/diheme cytochrome c family protein